MASDQDEQDLLASSLTRSQRRGAARGRPISVDTGEILKAESAFAKLEQRAKGFYDWLTKIGRSPALKNLGDVGGGRSASGGMQTIAPAGYQATPFQGVGRGAGGPPVSQLPGLPIEFRDYGRVGNFLGRFGGGDPYVGSMVVGQVSQAMGSAGNIIGGRGATTTDTGRALNLAEARLGYGRNVFSHSLGRQRLNAPMQAPFSGAMGGVDVAQGMMTLTSGFGPTQAARMGAGAAAMAAVMPGLGMEGTAGMMQRLSAPAVSHRMLPYGGAVLGPGGRVRSPEQTIRQLARAALGPGGRDPESLTPEQVEATYFYGRGRSTISAITGGDMEALEMTQRYALAAAQYGQRHGGRRLNVERLGRTEKGRAELERIGLGTSFFQDEMNTEQGRARKDQAYFNDSLKLREAELAAIRAVNAGLKELSATLGPASFGLEKFGSGAAMVSDSLITFFGLKSLLGSGGGGGMLAGAEGLALAGGMKGRLGRFGVGALSRLRPGMGMAGMALGQIGGEFLAHQGGTGPGGKRWLGEDLGKMAKWTGAGAMFGPWGMLGGAVLGAGHIGLEKMGVLGGADVGDPPSGPTMSNLPGSQGLQPTFLMALKRMFAENPRLSITSGFRSRSEQQVLYNRYLRGGNLAAKPGTSKHEKGLAADIGPRSEYDWLAKNASRFGLKLPVRGEPWHVEPTGVAGTSPSDRGSDGGGKGVNAEASRRNMELAKTYGGPGGLTGAALVESLLRAPANIATFPSRGGGGGKTFDKAGTASMAVGGGGAGKLSASQIRQYAQAAGFTGTALETMVAIALAESSGRPNAHNPNAKTGDNSYGLWQINMLGNLGPERRKQFGISNNEQLWDPATNARAAFIVSGGGTNFQPWSVYKSGAYKQHLDSGDPPPAGGGGIMLTGGGGVTIQNMTLQLSISTERITDSEARRLAELTMREIEQMARDTQVGRT